MTDNSAWRDESKLPLSELEKAMASWDIDGQNDPTGNDAGEEEAGGRTNPEHRPSTTGRTGPN